MANNDTGTGAGVVDGLAHMLSTSDVTSTADSKKRRQIDRAELLSRTQHAIPVDPVERLAEWDRRRAERQARKRQESQEAAAAECTFHPAISKVAAAAGPSPTDVIDRLHERGRLSEAQRQALAARAETVALRECTFSPEIHASPIGRGDPAPSLSTDNRPDSSGLVVLEYIPVEDRVTQSHVHHMLGSDWHDRVDPECTFRPAISPVAQEVYSSARARESQLSVFDRLYIRSHSCPRHATAPATESPDLEPEVEAELLTLRSRFGVVRTLDDPMLAFYCNVLGTSNPDPIAQILDHSDIDPTEPACKEDELADVRFVRFNDFIARQNELELRRRMAIERVRAETASSFQPPICAKSIELARRARSKEPKPKTAAADAPTFRPVLSSLGARHRGRSTDDMLRDAERVAAHREQLRAAKEKSESKELTFKPRLGMTARQYPGVQSMLSVDKLERLSERLRMAHESRRHKELAARQAKLDDEVAQCTFRPKLNTVPLYISDMAKSAAVLRHALV